MMDQYLCIHGHFYQPPRENPWLEAIELQDSAYPYHDWNERITAECYRPNAYSRILDSQGRIVQITNNYSRISFNFGPTLLSWMEQKVPDVYAAVIQADRLSRERFSGHGSALAQPYNHMIMPLANSRDRFTQVIWGIRDFTHRFGRQPDGMWLPETAVDVETLEILAELGIRFTILEPGQAARVHRLTGRAWKDVAGGGIDPTRPYVLRLPTGREINLFFYDGPIARAVAFEGVLSKGEHFAERLTGGFSDRRTWPQLVHIATDGESYGHHHRHGDMALAYALDYIESQGLAHLSNYGEFLERFPPDHEVQIREDTSWSCAHGVERWRSGCGCATGAHPDWDQSWRAPLREALDWLRDTIAPAFEDKAGGLLKDPWGARNDYIHVILDRSPERVSAFLRKHEAHPLTDGQTVAVLKLMELQRHAMLMYTSCGWFFDDVSGIESVQVLQYAGRVIQLAEDLFGGELEPSFLEIIEQAKSNVAGMRDGRYIFQRFVEPSVVGLGKVAAHFAISSLFESYPHRASIFCYTAEVDDYRASSAGQARLAVGRVRLTSEVTRESQSLGFGVLHFGDHNIAAGVRPAGPSPDYERLVQEFQGAFGRADLTEVIRLLDRHFGELGYSLKSLFRDEQRKIIDLVLGSMLAETEGEYRQIYEHHAPLMRFMRDVGYPIPRAFQAAAEFVINANLRHRLTDEEIDAGAVTQLMDEAALWGLQFDEAGLAFSFQQTIERLGRRFAEEPHDLPALQRFENAVRVARSLPFTVDLFEAQNIFYRVMKAHYAHIREAAEHGHGAAREWAVHFLLLGDDLAVHVG